MKSFTDLNQSKKLAEILPPESADMEYMFLKKDGSKVSNVPFVKDGFEEPECCYSFVPCWSLAVLMDVLDRGALFKTPKGWVCQTYVEYKAINSNYHSNPVDACVEMILELHKQKDK